VRALTYDDCSVVADALARLLDQEEEAEEKKAEEEREAEEEGEVEKGGEGRPDHEAPHSGAPVAADWARREYAVGREASQEG
jgi:hypothetical protein